MAAQPPLVLSLAGHDPTRGAGVDADLEAIAAAGGRGRAVVSAWTEQDGWHVRELRAREPSEWRAEAERALLERPAALKTGLLPSAASVCALAEFASAARERFGADWPVVVDPVLASSGGERFLDAAGVDALRERLLPIGLVLTPNLPELAELAGVSADALERESELAAAAERLLRLGARAVVVKGGHARTGLAVDRLFGAAGEREAWSRPRLIGRRLHGSGCRFASYLACHWARSGDLAAAAEAAGDYLHGLLERLPGPESPRR